MLLDIVIIAEYLVLFMGNSGTSVFQPTPNVKERHARALYINVPVSHEIIHNVLHAPCVADQHNGHCWISIVIDDLDMLEAYVLGTYIPTGLKGWMCKVNLLVKCPVPSVGEANIPTEDVHGYQILTIDFEDVTGGQLKAWGAKYTQHIPSSTAHFEVSSGVSGTSIHSPLENDCPYSAVMTSNGEPLVSVTGVLRSSLSPQQVEFTRFVTDRPHKFLHQDCRSLDKSIHRGTASRLAYSPEDGDGASFSHAGCVWLEAEAIALPVLDRLGGGVLQQVDLKHAQCFIQPYYILVDHHNITLS